MNAFACNKYKARRTERAGMSFASKAEGKLFDHLTLLQKAGELRELRSQVSVYLTAARIQYIADFQYFDVRAGQITWAEMKGFETPEWRLKRRLWAAGYGPGTLRVFKMGRADVMLVETIKPKSIIEKPGDL